MEHDAFVPFSVGVVRRALAEPDRVARCVSALQRDAASPAGPPAGTLTGRLRLRIGGSSITYRGSLRIAECDGGFEIEGEGAEARGGGVVKVALVIGLDPEDTGTRIGFSGAVQAAGRLTDYDDATVEAAGRRLLDRFVADLVADLDVEPPAGAEAAGAGPDARDAHDFDVNGSDVNGSDLTGSDLTGSDVTGADVNGSGLNGSDATASDVTGSDVNGADVIGADGVDGADAAAAEGTEAADAVDGSDVVGADDAAEEADGGADEADGGADEAGDDAIDVEVPETVADLEDARDDQPPAEAAHARRTMIGRSAEEVDHAPPRGRYAPVAAPSSGSASDTLRWAAPAAAALLASAVVVGRALRKRK
jgi:carbon monoxide dehydrogenase subunit G